ncbi:MAG: hypothetical protein ACP5KV_06730 [Candidatus Methanomethylicaceae archaeon]
MDSLSAILAESIVGMGITIALLALLALIFHILGRLGGKEAAKIEPELTRKEADLTSLLPFIATAVYLYRAGKEARVTKRSVEKVEVIKKSAKINSCREEWRRCGRKDFLR